MIEVISKINTATDNTAIIVGSYARYFLDNTSPAPKKKWIDVSIYTEYVESVKNLGTVFELKGGTSFKMPIEDQFVVKLASGYFLDVFVNNGQSNYVNINGTRVLTQQGEMAFKETYKEN